MATPTAEQSFDKTQDRKLGAPYRLLTFFASVFLRTLLSTLRWKTFEIEKIREELDWKVVGNEPQGAKILAIWHGQQVMLPSLYFSAKKRGFVGKVYTLISKHKDGRIASDIIKHFGIDSVAGSSTRGGAEALHELVKKVEAGGVAVITPDGPKGPIYKAKAGVVKLAEVTGVKIYPVVFKCHNGWTLKSWDRMVIPKAFSACECFVNEPITVKKGLSEDEFKGVLEELERRMK